MRFGLTFIKNFGVVLLVLATIAAIFGFVLGLGILGGEIGSHWDVHSVFPYEERTWPGAVGFFAGCGLGASTLVALYISLEDWG